MLNIENMDQKFHKVVQSDEWKELQTKFNQATNIYVLGHGGNLGIADHAAVDISRLSNGTKNAQAPGSAIVDTSLINDTNFDQWMVQWVKQLTTGMTLEQKKLYKQMKKLALAQFDNGELSTTQSGLTQIMRLQQIVCGHLQPDDGTIQPIKNNRLSSLLEVVDELQGKAIIWATWTHDVMQVADALRRRFGDA